MIHTVDARGLACPQPVVNSRKALDQNNTIVTIVDNLTAVENIRRMAASIKCTVTEEKKADGIYLTISKPGTSAVPSPSGDYSCTPSSSRVLAISQDVFGKGDDALGKVLMKSFFHTLAETPPAPETIIFFNSGVKLVAEGSDVLEDIVSLEKSGVKILSCGTCLDFYKLKDCLKAGSITNMYEIKELLLGGSSIVNI